MLTPTERVRIVDAIIEREGGSKVTNHPSDPGGLTKFGISQRAYPDLDIRSLTREKAVAIYLRDYLHKYKLHEMTNARNAEILCDWLVNGTSVKRIQRALKVTEDGVIGRETLNAANAADPHDLLIARLNYYASITGHPFIKGWIHRLIQLGL